MEFCWKRLQGQLPHSASVVCSCIAAATATVLLPSTAMISSPFLTFSGAIFLALTAVHCQQALDRNAGILLGDGSRRQKGPGNTSTLQLVALTTTSLFFFLLTKTEGPGYLPYGWRPRHIQETYAMEVCHVCQGYKAPRTHHCSR